MSEDFVKDYKEWRQQIEDSISEKIGAPFKSTGLTLDYDDGDDDFDGVVIPSRCFVTLNGYIEIDKKPTKKIEPTEAKIHKLFEGVKHNGTPKR